MVLVYVANLVERADTVQPMANRTQNSQYLAESNTTILTVFLSIPIFLIFSSTGLRLWAKKVSGDKHRFAFDDYLMAGASVVTVVECVLILIYGTPYGLGRHIEALPTNNVILVMMGNYLSSHFYDTAIALTKLSVLALYYRVFITRSFRIVVIITSVFITLWLLTMVVALVLECRPIQAWWFAAEGTCVNLFAFACFINITSLVTDLWIFAMPIPVILKLNADSHKRIVICFLFSMGLGTCAISAGRLAYMFTHDSLDLTWNTGPISILSAWELCGGILCANLPMVFGGIVRTRRPSVAQNGDSKTMEQSGRGSNRDWMRLNSTATSAQVSPWHERQ